MKHPSAPPVSSPHGSGAVVHHIMYTNPDYLPPFINEARLLADAGFWVKLICREYKGRWGVQYPPTMSMQRVGARFRSSWLEFGDFVLHCLRNADPSAVAYVGHDTHGFLVARLLAARHRRPVIYRCHDFAEDRPSNSGGLLAQIFERAFARTADLVVVPDAERAGIVARRLRLRRDPFVAANAPLSRPPDSDALHAALKSQGHRFDRVLLRQGRIGPGHAIEATIRSMPLWSSRTWGLVLLGYGERAYLHRLTLLARQLGADRQLAILPPVGYDDVARFTVGATAGHALYEPIHVNNRTIATASNKIMEYMAAGLPLIVSKTPRLEDLVHTHGCGLTADESSPASIAGAVNAILTNPRLSRAMGASGQLAFDAVFRYDRQYNPVLMALTELTQGRVAGARGSG